jgi:hypothetical protein
MTVSDVIAQTDLMNENLHIRLTLKEPHTGGYSGGMYQLAITEAEVLIKQLTAAVKTAKVWKAEGAAA